MEILRPTWAEINLANLAFNFRQLKKIAGKKVAMLAAVKANAYGHGIVEVSRKLQECGVDYFGVASVDEALILRRAGIKLPILILGCVYSKKEMVLAVKLDLTVTLADYRMLIMLNSFIQPGRRLKAHIKIDTGMGRLGIWHEDACGFIIKAARFKKIFIEGVYTHFASADEDKNFTLQQIKDFKRLMDKLKALNVNIPLAHAANSAGLLCFKAAHLNMVRPGIMLYGMSPDKKMRYSLDLKPVLSLKTRITYIKSVNSGRSISYGRTYITKKKTRIATLPIGYADGYARALSNKAKVLINGRFFPVAGRICMDQTMVDVGNNPRIKLGDRVVLIGSQKKKNIRVEDIASICSTIPYEISCGISSRVTRVFKKS